MSSAFPNNPRETPVVLCVLDGWGEAPASAGNAITEAGLTVLPELMTGPWSRLDASGEAVGLPPGIMGNSEVGHLTLGAGRIVDQDLLRINKAMREGPDGSAPVANNENLVACFEAVKKGSGRLHYFGLASDAGVHSDLAHLETLIRHAADAGIERQVVHAFTDGRDTPPHSGVDHLGRLEKFLVGIRGATIGTVMGRYHAMDRDKRWPRTEKACRALLQGEARREGSAVEALRRSYDEGVTDEFVEPVLLADDAPLRDGDGVIVFNFRADRVRQITDALTTPGFSEFEIHQPKLSTYTCTTRYREDFDLPVLFEREHPQEVLGDVFAGAGWPQLRLAETEKYGHVTYFLNGGREEEQDGENRIMIPSPKVATYDLQPEMSAAGVTEEAIRWVKKGGSRFLAVNYANADMVGHSGKLNETLEAVRTVDACVGRLLQACREVGAVCLVTSDHGNAEIMIAEDGGAMTSHTTSPVPLLVVDPRGPSAGWGLEKGGGLCDVAPTLLRLAGLPVPSLMGGRCLVRED
ncbi:MAG: 2,3-bisphosphoglycerate-independent phosphoglycerate mutase [Acidobacteriota bacterium]